ncbi:TPA: hypothetical protein DDW35_04095, partial [Candidatus Sumerlaeota bacterium]|nr:hypothetical protein [Candidatus Sumerlaeota bacterium]
GNHDVLALVEDGLSKISEAERAAIDQKWMGTPLHALSREILWGLGYVVAGTVALLFLLVLWNRSLRGQVGRKTEELYTALDELRESELRLMELIEHSPLATGVCDEKLKILLLNRRFVETFGYTLEDLPNLEQWWHFCHPDPEDQQRSREAWAMFVARALAGDTETFSREIRIQCKNGAFRVVEVASAPIGNRFVTVFNDVTARKEAEEKQRRLEEQMRHAQKLESLGVLAGGIAHDFNNIMMAILGNADLALIEMPPTSPGRKYMVEIEKASLKAAGLCRQMLAYAGAQNFVMEPHDIGVVVHEMQHMLEVSMSKKIHFNLLFPENIPPVMIDVAQLQQVVMNLVINASEAVGERAGTITIATAVMDCDRDYLDMVRMDTPLPEGRYVTLAISDDGCGMNHQMIDRIFDPFFSTKFTGRGLGLAAVLGIVHSHNGAIKVYSEPEKGTTFKVLLPAVKDMAAVPKPPVSEPSSALHADITLLLVDDEPAIQTLGVRMLERLGFQVLVANDGVEAVEVFKVHHEKIACVLLDMTMPRMDGESAFLELRKIKLDVPIIIASGYSERDVVPRFINKGPVGYIEKPYQMATLASKLHEALGEFSSGNN